MKYYYLLSFLFFFQTSFCQRDTIEFSSFSIQLDSLVVTATRKGFDVNDFIKMIQEDESFYKAFRNIRTMTYTSDNDLKMFSKKGKVKASLINTINQTSDGRCRTMKTINPIISGKFYKRKKKIRYYTAKMHDRLFFTYGKVCESKRIEDQEGYDNSKNLTGMRKHINELKKLIFYPGKKADIPFIGKKTAIFEKNMAKFYDFSISSKTYKSKTDCYVFLAKVKNGTKHSKTVIKYMETFFDKKTFQVIARNYHLSHSGTMFDFDVKMDISLNIIGEKYVPEFITYDGQWDVPFNKPEVSKFKISFYNFE
ncbi:hypothetical protein OAG16_00690 [Saprospiraceae bacterium]|nr:hypothetical protein [bacterium]MDB4768564.1 hypothetical protein [Saprospiraceae bacterium]MDG1433212.1 hypothetical protein [Saprospiraceae bacterium]